MITKVKKILKEKGVGYELMVTPSESAIYENDTRISDFILIPVYQICHKYTDGSEYRLGVAAYKAGKQYDVVECSYMQAMNMNFWYSTWGYHIIGYVNHKQYEAVSIVFKVAFAELQTKNKYHYEGYIGNNFVYGNQLIEAQKIQTIENESKTIINKIHDANESCRHMLEHAFGVLKNQSKAKLIVCFVLLSFMVTRLKKTSEQHTSYGINFGIYLQALRHTGKTSVALALTDPLKAHSGSFEDTIASIKHRLKHERDIIVLTDDMSKLSRPGMNDKCEQLIRICGDENTSACKMVGNKIYDESIDCLSLFTGEQLPRLQASSYPRMLIVKLDRDEVNWEHLSVLQNSTDLTYSFYIHFIQHTIYTSDFTDVLKCKFLKYRSIYLDKFKAYNLNNRYADMISWILSIWDLLVIYLHSHEINMRSDDFIEWLEKMILEQGVKYSVKTASDMFLRALFNLIADNELNIVSISEAKQGKSFDLIDMGDKYFVKSKYVYEQVVAYYKGLNTDFYFSERNVRSDLYKNNLLLKLQNTSNLTVEFKTSSNKSVSGFYLMKNNAREFISKIREDEE